MRHIEATLMENNACGPHAYVLRFSGCAALSHSRPGQFVMLRGAWGTDPLLPRAFSVLSVLPGGEVEILGKAIGKATRLLQSAEPGERFTMLGPLGRPFAPHPPGQATWLVAGGVGIAPLLFFAQQSRSKKDLQLFYGGRSQADLVLADRIKAAGITTYSSTDDGSYGHRGLVVEPLAAALDAVDFAPTLLCCGPEPMLVAIAAIARAHKLKTFLSLEGEMACGIGVCLGCAVPCATRPYRYSCVDGPVMDLDELRGPYA